MRIFPLNQGGGAKRHGGCPVGLPKPRQPAEGFAFFPPLIRGNIFRGAVFFKLKDVTTDIHRFSMKEQFIFAVTEMSQVAEVRRQVVALASKVGFNPTEVGKAALVATEAATNLAKHSVQGEVLIRLLEDQDRSGIEILALDKGPGMVNVAQSLRDGYSTAGSPGTGMGAMRRLAGSFDLHSAPTKGTAVLAEVWSGRAPEGKSPDPMEVGVVCRAKRNELVCGDGWGAASVTGRVLLLVVDGLGHGLGAATAAQEAIRSFRSSLQHSPARIVESAHAALRSTRGAVLGIAEIDLSQKLVRYAGVGNISGVIVSDQSSRHLVSTNGTVGQDVRKVQEFSYPFPTDAVLVLHSDGLTSHWNLSNYPGLLRKAPGLIAGILYRDYQRGSDDVTVVAARAASVRQ
jgi:anti-sigma regulatory factor (Ser/Thr protein kinase)